MTARCAQRASYQLFRKEKRGKEQTEQLAPQWLHLLLSGVAAAKPLLRLSAAKCSGAVWVQPAAVPQVRGGSFLRKSACPTYAFMSKVNNAGPQHMPGARRCILNVLCSDLVSVSSS